jgi:FkbM family methyltransferase
VLRIIIIFLSKVVKKAGYAFLWGSQVLERVNGSRLVERGSERDLYRTRFNDFFWLNKASSVDKCIIESGLFEPASTECVKKLVSRGNVILDVGANIGYYSVLFSRLVGNEGRVLCFEPTKYFGKVLKKNLEANNIDNAEIFGFGLSNKHQQLEIQIGYSSATIHNPRIYPSETSETIDLVPLDEFIEKNDLQTIDFVKVDIDGHEPLFFAGAWKTLDRYDPIILLEVSHLHYLEAGFTAWDFFDVLKNKGYRIYHEDNLAELKTREDFLIKCGNFAYSSNIIKSKKQLKAK